MEEWRREMLSNMLLILGIIYIIFGLFYLFYSFLDMRQMNKRIDEALNELEKKMREHDEEKPE